MESELFCYLVSLAVSSIPVYEELVIGFVADLQVASGSFPSQWCSALIATGSGFGL